MVDANGGASAARRLVGRVRRLPAGVLSLAIAALLLVAVFPEVFLLGGSLSPAALNDTLVGRTEVESVSVYPNPEDLEPRTMQFDIGARVWQLEPAIDYMHRVIYEGESLEWNRYSATGSLGTETLADIKLSPFVLLVALLGATSTAFTVVLLLFLLGALYCLQQFFVRTLRMSRLAAIAACLFFLLNGWAADVIGSQTSAPYVLFPVVLYTLCEYQRSRGWWRFLAAVAVHAALFATTFLPGVVLVLIITHAVALLIGWQREHLDSSAGAGRQAATVVSRQVAVPVVAALATAFVWFPAVVAVLDGGDELAGYGRTDLPSRAAIEALAILTPRHVFRWYVPGSVPAELSPARWTVYLGVAALVVVLAAVGRTAGLARRLLVLCLALTAVGVLLHLGVSSFSWIALLPGLRPISASYWASFAAAAGTIAFGVAIDAVRRRGLSVAVAGAATAVILVVFAVALATREDVGRGAIAGLGLAFAVAVLVVGLAWLDRRWKERHLLVAGLLVGLAALELLSYQNHQRAVRFDREDRPLEFVAFLEDNLGDQRILNAGRGALYPEWGAAFGIREVGTLNLMQPPWYRDYFIEHLSPTDSAGKFLEIGRRPDEQFRADPEALDELAVRYLVVDTRYERIDSAVAEQYPLVLEDRRSNVRVYENPDALPRAHVSTGLSELDGANGVRRWDSGASVTDDERLLDEARAAGVPTTGDVAADAATIVEDDGGRVVVEVNASQPGVLVLSDAFHRGWSVTVDGEEQHLGRVNEAFRGVVVPAGQSTVVFDYDSPARRIGAFVSVGTALALAVISVVVAVRSAQRRRSRPSSEPRSEPVGASR